MTPLTPKMEELCATSRWDFSDLRAVFINCTLKRSPERLEHPGRWPTARSRSWSATASPSRRSAPSTTTSPPACKPDMTEHGWERDGWPAIFERVSPPTSSCCCTPIWLGEKSSVCTQVIERLYGNSHLLNDAGQYAYYGRVGGCLVTGNEDGVKHCAMNILYSLQHLGYAIPPQADAGWIGEAGPGPSYLDPGSGGPENDFTNRNTTFMTWNLLHLARMLKDAGGIPAHGNQRSDGTPAAASTTPTPSTAEAAARRLRRRGRRAAPRRRGGRRARAQARQRDRAARRRPAASARRCSTTRAPPPGPRRGRRARHGGAGARAVTSLEARARGRRPRPGRARRRAARRRPRGGRRARRLVRVRRRRPARRSAASRVLWPEHFDIAIELGRARPTTASRPATSSTPSRTPTSARGPPRSSGELWNATGFRGAELTYAELLAAPDPRAAALEFFTTRKEALA